MKIRAVLFAAAISAAVPASAGGLGAIGSGAGVAQFGAARMLSGGGVLGAQGQGHMHWADQRASREAAGNRGEQRQDRAASLLERSRHASGAAAAAGETAIGRAPTGTTAGAAGALTHASQPGQSQAPSRGTSAGNEAAESAAGSAAASSPPRPVSAEAGGQGSASFDRRSQSFEAQAAAHASAGSEPPAGN